MGELIVNSDSYPDRVPAARKACGALVKELGMTRTDLRRPMLQIKLTEFIQDRMRTMLESTLTRTGSWSEGGLGLDLWRDLQVGSC